MTTNERQEVGGKEADGEGDNHMKPKTEMAVMREMLRERQRMLATQGKQLDAANELLSSIRQENRRLALAVAAQTGRIAELERQVEASSGYHDVTDLYEDPAKPELEAQ